MEQQPNVSKYTKAEKIMCVYVVLITIFSGVACGLISYGYKKQTDKANRRYSEIQKEDATLRASVNAREALIHKAVKGNTITGEELATFNKVFGNEYSIQIKDLESKETKNINKENQYEIVVKTYEEDKFNYVFKECNKE